MTEEDLHEKIVDRVIKNNKDEFYDNFDAAVDRWLDKKFAQFGKWALGGMAAALFIWGIKLWVQYGGFPK